MFRKIRLQNILRSHPTGVWVITITAFLLCSGIAAGMAYGTVSRRQDPPPIDEEIVDTTEAVDRVESAEVTTKSQNTGDPVMTTSEITLPPETTTAEITTVTETTIETTTQVYTTAIDTTVETTAPETTTAVETEQKDHEPVYYDDGDWNMLLVNPWNPMPDGYVPDLVSMGNGQQADYRVKDALNAMLTDCRKAGYNPIICSSYRTVQRQQTLFENETKAFMEYGYDRDQAEAYAAKWVARPGTSEHHTGLAFDIVASSYQRLDNTQANTPEQKWLMANCHKYGFILRYPENKTEITGINYEPWHYRYVGLDIAKEITEKQITLEEYFLQGTSD